MKKLIIGTIISVIVIDAFLAGVYVEKKQDEKRMASIQQAIEDGNRIVFTNDGGIIIVRR